MPANINNALAINNCDAIVDSVDAGAGPGLLKIYTGAMPATVDEAATGTLLATLTMSDPAFGAAADDNPGAIAAANAITGDTSADATGTAGYFRIEDSNGVAKIQGTIGATGSGNPLELNSVSIQAGVNVDVTSLTVKVPE